jgi:hypothetical protein
LIIILIPNLIFQKLKDEEDENNLDYYYINNRKRAFCNILSKMVIFIIGIVISPLTALIMIFPGLPIFIFHKKLI